MQATQRWKHQKQGEDHEKNAHKFNDGGAGGYWVHVGGGSRSSRQGDEKNQAEHCYRQPEHSYSGRVGTGKGNWPQTG